MTLFKTDRTLSLLRSRVAVHSVYSCRRAARLFIENTAKFSRKQILCIPLHLFATLCPFCELVTSLWILTQPQFSELCACIRLSAMLQGE